MNINKFNLDALIAELASPEMAELRQYLIDRLVETTKTEAELEAQKRAEREAYQAKQNEKLEARIAAERAAASLLRIAFHAEAANQHLTVRMWKNGNDVRMYVNEGRAALTTLYITGNAYNAAGKLEWGRKPRRYLNDKVTSSEQDAAIREAGRILMEGSPAAGFAIEAR